MTLDKPKTIRDTLLKKHHLAEFAEKGSSIEKRAHSTFSMGMEAGTLWKKYSLAMTGKENSPDASFLEMFKALVWSPVRPQFYKTATDKVSLTLFNGDISPTDKEPTPIGLNAAKTKIAYVRLDYEELLSGKEIERAPTLTHEDRQVHDAIATLYYAGNAVQTYGMIYRVMAGKYVRLKEPTEGGDYQEYKHSVPKEAIAQIEHALTAFRGTISIKFGEGKNKAEFEEPLVMFGKVTAYIGGHFVRAINIAEEPVLMRWAGLRNQIDTRLITSLSVGTYRTRTLKDALYRRIISMKNEATRKKIPFDKLLPGRRSIRFDSLMAATGKTPKEGEKPSAVVKREERFRQHVKSLLEEWTAQEFIPGWGWNKAGRKITGVEIKTVKK